MKTQQASQVRISYRSQILLLLIICTCIMLSGCTRKQAEPGEVSAPQSTTVQTSSQTSNITSTDNEAGIPAGVTIRKVIRDESLNNKYYKKVELLTDGGKLKTITDANQKIVTREIEYEGIIIAVNGQKVTVQVEEGVQKTITITETADLKDKANLGLKPGVEIEWEIEMNGKIVSVELED